MQKFNAIKTKYLHLGVSEDNIDYAIGSVRNGTKREHILETLTSDYRGMSETHSTEILIELFEANGGEFKKENRGGYLFCLMGLAGAGFLIGMLMSGEWKLKFLGIALTAAIVGLTQGPALLIKSARGKYRDADEPL